MALAKVELGNGEYVEVHTGKKRRRYSHSSPDQKQRMKDKAAKWRSKNVEKTLYNNIRLRAKQRNIPFNLTIEDIIIPSVCPVLGIPIQKGNRRWKMNSPSVDRINPALGYVKGNVIIISQKANLIKSNATPEEILQVAYFFLKLKETKKAA